MKIKLDENFDVRIVPVLSEAGHDVDTVRDEKVSGSPDEVIYEVCRATARVLITLDLDFADPFRFPPERMEGIVVVRPPRATLPAIRATLVSVIAMLKSEPLKGFLWIVEPGRIRVYQPRQDEEDPQGNSD